MPPIEDTGADALDTTVDLDTSVDSSTPAETGADQTGDELLEAIYDKHFPSRDEQGRFAGAQTDEETTDQPQQADPEQPEATEAPAAIEAPNAWSAEQKAKFATLPPDVQAYITQRESEAHQTISRMGQERAEIQPVRELLDQYGPMFDSRGMSRADGVATLLQAQAALDNDPVRALAAIADSYGINLAATFGQDNPGSAEVGQLRQTVFALQQQLASRESAERYAAEQQEHQLREQTQTEVQTWAEGKDHFQAVRGAMASLMQTNPSASLDDLYEMACNAIPEVRAKVRAAEDAKRREEQQRHASQAKRVGALNVGTGKRAVRAPAGKSWDDDSYLDSVFDRVAG
jgi:hypothetical protein